MDWYFYIELQYIFLSCLGDFMTIKQCEYVKEIVKCGSFSKAANNLFISQSNLSMVIKDLEDEFCIKIFVRSNKGVSLTEDGSAFLSHAVKILEQVQLLNSQFKNNDENKKLCIYTQHYDFAADVFADFVNKHSSEKYKFVFKETKTAAIIKNVNNNNCDIGVIVIKHGDRTMERYLKNNHISIINIGEASPHIFVRKDHPISSDKVSVLSELSKYPYVVYGQGDYGESLFQEELIDQISTKNTIEIYDRATLMNLLISTDAFTVGTGIMASGLNNGSIVAIPLDTNERYYISVIIPENVVLSSEATEFIEMLKNFLN